MLVLLINYKNTLLPTLSPRDLSDGDHSLVSRRTQVRVHVLGLVDLRGLVGYYVTKVPQASRGRGQVLDRVVGCELDHTWIGWTIIQKDVWAYGKQ